MTSHRNHDHPATPAARAACRKAVAADPLGSGKRVTVTMSDAPPNLPGVVIRHSGSYVVVQLDGYRRPVSLLHFDVTPA